MKDFYCDIETGGINYKTDAILQIAGLIVIDEKMEEEVSFLLKPYSNKIINDDALIINGLTREQIEGFEDSMNIYNNLINIMKKYVDPYDKNDKFNFIGYCSWFDFNFLKQFFKDSGDKFFGSWFKYPPIDVYTLVKQYLKNRRDINIPYNYKLVTILEHFNIPTEKDKLHEALYDIKKTKELYNIISNYTINKSS